MNETSMPPSKPWLTRLKSQAGRIRKALPFVAGMAAAFLGLLLYNTAFPAPVPLSPGDVSTLAAQVMASVTPQPAFSEQVYQIIQPSLVAVQSQDTTSDGKAETGLGTGVVVDDAGDILTALHVVANSHAIQVTFADGTQSSAQVTLEEPQNDIAVLRADQPPAKIVPATLGNPDAMRVGDEAYIVGNPFGLYNSMSAGVISGFNRAFTLPGSNQQISGLIQVDAAVNPGNSGGPLLNRAGQVIGIVEGLANPTGQDVFIGISFAVPINVAGGGMGSPPD